MYKDIIKLIIALVSCPGKTWDMLSKKEESQEEFFSRFPYPLMGVVAVVAFVAIFLTRKEFDLQIALKSAILSLIVTFGGFFATSYLLNEIGVKWLNIAKNLKLWQRFVGYNSSVMFALNMILLLLPEFFFLRVLVLYIFYMVWEGAPIYMGTEEVTRFKFTLSTTACILAIPFIIEHVVVMLMPGLRAAVI